MHGTTGKATYAHRIAGIDATYLLLSHGQAIGRGGRSTLVHYNWCEINTAKLAVGRIDKILATLYPVGPGLSQDGKFDP